MDLFPRCITVYSYNKWRFIITSLCKIFSHPHISTFNGRVLLELTIWVLVDKTFNVISSLPQCQSNDKKLAHISNLKYICPCIMLFNLCVNRFRILVGYPLPLLWNLPATSLFELLFWGRLGHKFSEAATMIWFSENVIAMTHNIRRSWLVEGIAIIVVVSRRSSRTLL